MLNLRSPIPVFGVVVFMDIDLDGDDCNGVMEFLDDDDIFELAIELGKDVLGESNEGDGVFKTCSFSVDS